MWLDKLLPFVEKVVDRYGVKSLVACAADYVLYEMAKSGMMEGVYAGAGIVLITIAFFFGRHLEMLNKVKDK